MNGALAGPSAARGPRIGIGVIAIPASHSGNGCGRWRRHECATGYRKIQVRLNREGWAVGKNLVYRLYREEGLMLRRRSPRRRKSMVPRVHRPTVTRPNEAWTLDFVADQLVDGRRFRALTVIDVCTRECVAIEVGQSLRGEHVVAVLNRLKVHRGTPRRLFCDNGSEFSSQLMDLWAYHNKVSIDFSRPGTPTDNAHVESFNATLRRECLNATLGRVTPRSPSVHRGLAAGV